MKKAICAAPSCMGERIEDAVKRVVQLILSICLIIGLCACGQKETVPTWQEQYDLGVRYLSEGNYEEAIIAFAAAIEIDPKQADAYVSLADAYMGAGDYENAEATIKKGREACGDLEAFDRISDNIQFLTTGETGIRITDFYFDREAYLSGKETEYLVSVAYRCPENVDCILMIGANTNDPHSFRMLDEDYAVSGSGGYQFFVTVTPHQWEETYFGIYVNLSEANHAETWTPFDSDRLYIDPEGNVVGEAPYEDTGYNSSSGWVFDNPLRWNEVELAGVQFDNCSLDNMASAYAGSYSDDGTTFFADAQFSIRDHEKTVMYMNPCDLEFRGLSYGMSMYNALKAVGFSEDGIAFVEESRGICCIMGDGVCHDAYEDLDLLGEGAYDAAVILQYGAETQHSFLLLCFDGDMLNYAQITSIYF